MHEDVLNKLSEDLTRETKIGVHPCENTAGLE